MSYERTKLRIKLCVAELDKLMVDNYGARVLPERLLDAAFVLACDMSEAQQDAYLALFLLDDSVSIHGSKRAELFRALLAGTWQQYVWREEE